MVANMDGKTGEVGDVGDSGMESVMSISGGGDPDLDRERSMRWIVRCFWLRMFKG